MAINRKGKEAPRGVKTRHSRFLSKIMAAQQARLSRRWQGVVPKSVALHNMCGDNAWKRGTA